jgi:hypothetical protein
VTILGRIFGGAELDDDARRAEAARRWHTAARQAALEHERAGVTTRIDRLHAHRAELDTRNTPAEPVAAAELAVERARIDADLERLANNLHAIDAQLKGTRP